MNVNAKLAVILLRVGLAFVFFYAAVAAFIDPPSWIGFFPIYLRDLLPNWLLISGFGFYELLLGFWLLSGKYGLPAAAVSALTFLGIIIANIGAFDIVFRDVGLFSSAAALVILSYQKPE